MTRYNIEELLRVIDPKLLGYQEWINVGFIMYDAGMTAQQWEEWSSTDSRHVRGECFEKWKSFGKNPGGVTIGTLVQYAKQQGWRPNRRSERLLDWNDYIGGEDVDGEEAEAEAEASDVTPQLLEEPQSETWDQRQEIIRYLRAVFEPSDLVGYVTETWNKAGKEIPTRGAYDRTAEELIRKLETAPDISYVIGTPNPEVGAWIRFNPLDGQGVGNDNVTAFRYTLVESDTMELSEQYAMLKKLNLPIRVLVSSGGKSLHAIVHVDASNREEYRERVNTLYEFCQKNGMEVDAANKNPSRLSRLPGVYRNGRKQYIVAENMGCSSYQEWLQRMLSKDSGLPEFEQLVHLTPMLEPLSPELIEGVLRQGHKMLVSGPSKAGKSFAMIELAIAIAKGKKWLGKQCAKGKVLYVNLELERASCLHRINAVCNALGEDDALHNLFVWNLRGKSEPLDKLAPKLIAKAKEYNLIAIIIDPIYKVLTGDENNAEQMAHFCAQFDRICTELGTAIIYCHHHSKGIQGGKKSMDRASGSGVFARDPDAMLDMIELEITQPVRSQLTNQAAKEAIRNYLNDHVQDWEEMISPQEQNSRLRLETAAGRLLDQGSGERYMEMLNAVKEAEDNAAAITAWRVEGTLREFRKPANINCWFKYPVHVLDNGGLIDSLQTEVEITPFHKMAEKGNKTKKAAAQAKLDQLVKAIEEGCTNTDGRPPTKQELVNYTGIPKRTVERLLLEAGYDFKTSVVGADGKMYYVAGKISDRKQEQPVEPSEVEQQDD